MIVVSNTTPLTYLIQIKLADVLHDLYGEVVIPGAVFTELQRDKTPAAVRSWIANRPVWLRVEPVRSFASLPYVLHAGEYEVILLAKQKGADIAIIDELKGRKAAREEGLNVIGTLRLLFDGAQAGLCDLEDAYGRLQKTNFRASAKLYQHFLELYKKGREVSSFL